MPGALTYAAVVVMARDRIGQIRDALDAKLKARGAPLSDIERHIHHLAKHAYDLMSAGPSVPAPLTLYGNLSRESLAKFALMGGVGPDILKFAGFAQSGQRWLWDTVHKGNPDENREHVLVHSTDFAFDLYRRAETAINQNPRVDQRPAAIAKMRSYMLGHMCHVAADVICHPFVDDIAFNRDPDAPSPALSRERIIAALETEVADKLFRAGADTRSDSWAAFWPAVDEVPEQFFEAYRETLENFLPAARRTGDFEKGFGDFEKAFADADPPRLSTGLVREGYDSLRTLVSIGTSWEYVDWMGATWWMFLPSLFALPFAGFLPNAVHLFRDEQFLRDHGLFDGFHDIEEKGRYELLLYPFAATAFLPALGALAATITLRVNGPIIFGWVIGAYWIIQAIVYFSTVGQKPDGYSWAFLFVIPMILSVIHIVWTLIHGGGEPRNLQLAFATLLHLLLSWTFVLCYWAFLHFGVEGWLDEKEESWRFWVVLAAWLVVLVGLWLATCAALRYWFTSKLPRDQAHDFVNGRRHFVRLFDDASLFRVPSGNSPTLADLYYPSGRRPLIKLWWEGGEPGLSVRVHADKLVFHFDAAHEQTILVPLGPTTPAEFAAYLTRAVKDLAGNASQKLKAKALYADDLDYELPPGEVFAVTTDFAVLGTTEATATPLFHAPKDRFSVRYGRSGVIEKSPENRTTNENPSAAARLTSQAAPNDNVIRRTAGADSLAALFRPGDILEDTSGATPQVRVVVSVERDDQLTVATPFGTPLAGATFRRRGVFRNVDEPDESCGLVSIGGGGATDLRLSVPAPGAFGSLFRPNDRIRVYPPGVAPEVRRIVTVVSDTQLTLDAPLSAAAVAAIPAAPSGVPFLRVGEAMDERGRRARSEWSPDSQAQVAQVAATPTQIQLVAGALDFTQFFKPGDRLQEFGGFGTRVIVSVDSPTQVTVATPFSPALPNVGAPPGARFRRLGDDRTVDTPLSTGALQSGPGRSDLTLAAPPAIRSFGTALRVGDSVRIFVPGEEPQLRSVTAVTNAQLTLDEPLLPLAGRFTTATFTRVSEDPRADGFKFVADSDDTLFTGESLMKEAVDLAALLCLGATSRVLPGAATRPAGAAGPVKGVVQVFRNWNLDRRRVNEWRMLVLGQAVSEKRGDPAATDAALSSPLPGDWSMLAGAGEPLSNELGWLPLVRSWLDMARRPGQSTAATQAFKPGDPTNHELSRAIAFLFDTSPPAPQP